MKKPYKLAAVWLMSLLLLGLSLTACGGESTPAAPDPQPATTEAQTAGESETDTTVTEEAATEATAQVTEEPFEAATEEVAETTEEEPGADEDLVAQEPLLNNEAVCQAVKIPDNPLIAEVSAEDWVKGPADAAITLIEYGDFQ